VIILDGLPCKMIYSSESYSERDIAKLSEIWEPRKEYIEKDLWVIRNFLSKEELEWLNKEADDPVGWYDTMRSPYGGNTKNKFLGYIPEYDPISGAMLVPKTNSRWGYREPVGFIEPRIESVVPKYFGGAGALQSFFEVPDEQIIRELGRDVDYAMGWHYERDDSDDESTQKTIVENSKTQNKKIVSEGKISASFNVYINDNFDGGILEFKNKDYVIKPEVGMLVNIPLYKEFEHRVTKVTNGNRHTIYGRCWDTADGKYVSTDEDC
jgi:hypothetical protein